ncbi:hypothetical protein SELMODRAFT_441865 [Selaginella moellendorffii]|uniref:Major facilitator superfamily (MFS) profile domain-containing protein n=1 Tax=Selaginella moellendorffii TaxID=88036 RepID=D8RN98_SELML|nr:protein ZINC INDUCED FACILITATOR-LIKE 1 [Selaginella moellendorffii]EFJ26462.1 hypothetical protein SELMODRAFT_441865 [Selaginella moellendorffii]|eukprot:XP_002972376.1 protein ZINC INDUCED FACILITATOR-LIKE 1 [Selaginella moellendorffii]
MTTPSEDLIKEPLLLKSSRECPGCKCMPHEEDGPPIKYLVLIGFIMLCNALPITILFPYLYLLVRDFNVADSESDIGYYAGFIGSSFMIGRFFTGLLWGVAADRYGRKPVMFCGIISVIIFNTLFGFSTSLWMAVVTRFCLGSLNGLFGTIQTFATEICNKKYRSLGLAVVSTAWGFGLVLGPAIGGFLAEPALKYPELFQGSLFDRYPYLLPPLCVTVFALLVLVACHFLPETLHIHAKEVANTPEIESGVISDDCEKRSIFQNKALIVSIALFCFASLHDIAFLEVFSLWALSSKSTGGLSFTSSDAGRVLTVAAFIMLICQLSFFPVVTRRLGPAMVTRIASGLTLPLLVIYPFMYELTGVWLWFVILTVSTLKYIFMEATTTGLAILVNVSVRQEERGTANGFSLSLLSLFKAIGPTAGGTVFAWSRNRLHAHFLPGNEFVFFFLGVWMLIVCVGTLHRSLPRSALI